MNAAVPFLKEFGRAYAFIVMALCGVVVFGVVATAVIIFPTLVWSVTEHGLSSVTEGRMLETAPEHVQLITLIWAVGVIIAFFAVLMTDTGDTE